MPETAKILNTRIILRNDSTVNWNAHSSAVLAKGEIGIEFTNTGAKIKIGDGAKSWTELDYFGGSEAHVFQVDASPSQQDNDVIKEAVKSTPLAVGDIAIVKRAIHGENYSYTAYVYNGSIWAAMDGNYNAKNVYFGENLLTTSAIGNISLVNGQATIDAAGKNLLDVWQNIFVKEDKNISVTQPSVDLTVTPKYLEIGTEGTTTATLNWEDGKYEYGFTAEEILEGSPASQVTNDSSTGAKATEYRVTYNGSTQTSPSEKTTFTLQSGTATTNAVKNVKGTVAYSQGNIPVSNLKKGYPSKRITSGTASTRSEAAFYWYIPMYEGFKYESPIVAPDKISEEEIKGLGKITGSKAYNKTLPTSIKANRAWKQYFIAVPQSYDKALKSAVDENGLPLTVEKASSVTINYSGTPILYDVFYISLAADYKTLDVNLTWGKGGQE